MEFLSSHHLTELLHTYGYLAVAVVVALESLGLPLPGETLLIAASVIAGTTHELNIAFVILAASLGAAAGQAAGYLLGWAIGFRLLRRYGRHIGVTDRRLAYGRALFQRHGVKVVVAARFVALLRTLAALLAGANRMAVGPFMVANVIGSALWSALYGFGAYALGHEAKHVAGPVGLGIGVIMVTALASGWLYVRRREQKMNIDRIR